MTTTFVPPQQRAAWQRLQQLAQQPLPHLRELLATGADARHASLQFEVAGLRLDASRQQVTPEVLSALVALAQESGVLEQAQAQARGETINTTEDRAVLHVALRGSHMPQPPWGEAISEAVQTELENTFIDENRARLTNMTYSSCRPDGGDGRTTGRHAALDLRPWHGDAAERPAVCPGLGRAAVRRPRKDDGASAADPGP